MFHGTAGVECTVRNVRQRRLMSGGFVYVTRRQIPSNARQPSSTSSALALNSDSGNLPGSEWRDLHRLLLGGNIW